MDNSAASYVHMVHQLIEQCLKFKMPKQECMAALSEQANIIPIITSTVWNELEKENQGFFKGYAETLEEKEKKKKNALDSASDTSKRIQQIPDGTNFSLQK